MILTTRRLTLREFDHDDWPAVLAYQQKPLYLRYYPWTGRMPEAVRGSVAIFLDQQRQDPRTQFRLAVTLSASGQLIGNCGVRLKAAGDHQGDTGFEVDPDHWGQGYATEAARAMAGFGFSRLGLHRLWAECVAGNAASARVLEKLGMRLEGRLRENQHFKGRWWDTLLYGLLAGEWRPGPEDWTTIIGETSMPEIETERLRLRPIRLDDLPALAGVWRDPLVMRYLPTGDSRSVDDTRIELAYMVDHWRERGFGVWAVILKETGEFAGYCGIQYLHVEPDGVTAEALARGTDVEVVAGLGRQFWGQGIAPEATRAALRYGLVTVKLDRIVAAIHPDNDASRHILGSMGMRPDDALDYYGGCPHFVIHRDEFRPGDPMG